MSIWDEFHELNNIHSSRWDDRPDRRYYNGKRILQYRIVMQGLSEPIEDYPSKKNLEKNVRNKVLEELGKDAEIIKWDVEENKCYSPYPKKDKLYDCHIKIKYILSHE